MSEGATNPTNKSRDKKSQISQVIKPVDIIEEAKVVQLEIKYEGIWKEVIRYDCAHGFAHRDAYNLQGKHTKEELFLSFEDALTLADEDIDDNWEDYRRRFLEGGII